MNDPVLQVVIPAVADRSLHGPVYHFPVIGVDAVDPVVQARRCRCGIESEQAVVFLR